MTYKILIPTDFSDNAFNAIHYAFELFKDKSSEFIILNTYYHSGLDKENLIVPRPSDEECERIISQAERNIKEFEEKTRKHFSNEKHQMTFVSRFGKFYEIMKETAAQKKIHLILMGTKGRSNKKSAIFGSNALNIMEEVRSCPVMAIPSEYTFKNPNEIVLPTSFRTHYKQEELKKLVDIARITKAPIRILHIQNNAKLTERQEENKKLLETILLPATFTHHRLYDIKINDGIRTFIQSRQSEMLAFVNKKHNFFGSIFSNPMIKELGMHTEIPLLAMHDSRE